MSRFRLANINKIIVTFSPFAENSMSARAFLARVTSDKLKATNPKCEIRADVQTNLVAPSIKLTWADNVTQTIDSSVLTVTEVVDEVSNGFDRFPEEVDA